MFNISDVRVKPLGVSDFKPFTMHYTQNGVKKTWDLLVVDERIVVIVHNVTKNTLLFLRQFRPAVYYGSIPEKDRKDVIDTEKYPPELGISTELCCRSITNKCSHVTDAKDEVFHAFGYDVPLDKIKKIATYRAGVGTTGNKQTAFYCEVTDDMKIAGSTAAADGTVEVVEMTVEETRKFVQQKHLRSPPNFLFGVYWFFYNKLKKVQM